MLLQSLRIPLHIHTTEVFGAAVKYPSLTSIHEKEERKKVETHNKRGEKWRRKSEKAISFCVWWRKLVCKNNFYDSKHVWWKW